MNTLPVPIPRAGTGPVRGEWQRLRAYVLALREWENLAPEQLPLQSCGSQLWGSVIMVENGTLFHQLGDGAANVITRARLHEKPSVPLLASAYLQPDLVLEVSVDESIGRDAAQGMLEHWLEMVRKVTAFPGITAQEAARLPAAVEAKLESWENGGPALPGPDHLLEAWQEARHRFARETAVWTPGEFRQL